MGWRVTYPRTIYKPQRWCSSRLSTIDVMKGKMYYQPRFDGMIHGFGMWLQGDVRDIIGPIQDWVDSQNLDCRDSSQCCYTIIQDKGVWFQWDFKNANQAMIFKLAWGGELYPYE